jgi:cell division septation protein DedD
MPPKTETTPVDLRYHDKLQGQTPPPAQPVPEPKPAEPTSAVSAPPTSGPAPQTSQAARPGRSAAAAPSAGGTSAAATPKAQEKPSAKPSQPVPTGWFVQVNAFKSKANADKQVTELKAKGHASAFVLSEPTGSLFRVRVGPIADRAEAERLSQRLKSEVGGSPTVQP